MERLPEPTLPANATRKTALFLVLGAVALAGTALAVRDLRRGMNQATSLYSVGVAGLSVEGDLQAFTQQSRRTLIYALTTSDPNEQLPFITQARVADRRVIELHRAFARIDLDGQTREALGEVEDKWRQYQAVRDEIVSLILEGRPREALYLEQKDGAAHFEACARSLQSLKEHLDVYAQLQLLRVQRTYYRSAMEIGMLVLMALLFAVVLLKLTELHREKTRLGELCDRERNLVLQFVSENRPLPEVLAAVQSLAERKYPGSVCAVRLVSGDSLIFGGGNRLPVAYAISAARSPIHPPSCTCALAVTRQTIAFTPRIDTDPVWSGNAADLLNSGIRSCLSVPISSASGEVIGTIALFVPEQEKTTGDQLTFLNRTARLAAVGIEQRLATDQLVFQARNDALTGLPNRVRLVEILTDRIARPGHCNWAVVWVNLDRFKPINDALGHDVGDMLLQAVSTRLQHCISESDTAAHIGGDEFVLVLDAAGPDAAGAVAAGVVAALGEPFNLSSHKLSATASVGVAGFPEHGATADELLRNADLAMYQAKRNGKNSFRFFDPDLAEGAADLLEIDYLLRSALDKEEMWLVYQPQVAESGEIAGVEALLRWENPVLGIVPPTQFIPIAEENGSINTIGGWVLRSACAQAAAWHAEGYSLRMSVNVSACQFARADFAETVAEALAKSGLAPGFLELEITETCIMGDLEQGVKQMRRLRKMGVRIAIDDFGTGNSSLSYLSSLPADTLKIDRSFVKGIDEGGMPIIHAIMTLARSMEIAIVAEGVEYEHQNRALRAERCDLIQGYYFFKPMTAVALLLQLRHQSLQSQAVQSVLSA
jgi:diguanylate cyclase (GGDEF)-like protein